MFPFNEFRIEHVFGEKGCRLSVEGSSMDDDDENLDWINCPHCGNTLYFPADGIFGDMMRYFFGRALGRRSRWHFFCARCCVLINPEEIVGREFNGVSMTGGEEYHTWRASNGDETIFVGKLKTMDIDSDEWKRYLRALGIEPDKLGINLNLEIEDDNRPLVIGTEGTKSNAIGIAILGTSSQKRKDGKKVVYIDMDGVLVDFKSALIERGLNPDMKDADDIGGLFSEMQPFEGAVEAFRTLQGMKKFDVYILSTAPWKNPSAWYDKLQWVKRYLGEDAEKRLILSHHKDLNWGSYLIDDREKRGANEFGKMKGQTWIHFGCNGCNDDDCRLPLPDWNSVLDYFQNEV
jgi:5'(3')-deoxyribonucleotidase